MNEYFDDYFRWFHRRLKEIELIRNELERTIDDFERGLKNLGMDDFAVLTCLNCKAKTKLLWNTDKDGTRIRCPHCGTPHILVDMHKTEEDAE